MNLNTWAKAQRGRAASLAKHFGVTPGAISQWLKNGPPRSKLVAIRDFTNGEVSLDELLSSTVVEV